MWIALHPWNRANFCRSSSQRYISEQVLCFTVHFLNCVHSIISIILPLHSQGIWSFQLNKLGKEGASLLILKHSIALGSCVHMKTVNSWENKAQITRYITLCVYSSRSSNTLEAFLSPLSPDCGCCCFCPFAKVSLSIW